MWLLNQFHDVVVNEVVPAIHADLGGHDLPIVTAGASIGAFNALAVLCRYPAPFRAAICMSGTYARAVLRRAGSATTCTSPPRSTSFPVSRVRSWTRCGSASRSSPPGGRVGGHRRVLGGGRVLGGKGVPNRVDSWGSGVGARLADLVCGCSRSYLDELC